MNTLDLIKQRAFQTRALTALLFVGVMLAGLFINRWTFFTLFSLIHFGCWWEYMRLLEKIFRGKIHPYARLGYMLAGFSLLIIAGGKSLGLGALVPARDLFIPVSLAGIILLALGILRQQRLQIKLYAAALAGIIYISLPWALLTDLYLRAPGIMLQDTYFELSPSVFPLLILGCIWVNDTMAYITGSLIGRRPLTSISPKKTWEGTLGGIFFAVIVIGWVVPRLYTGRNEWPAVFFLSIWALVIAVTGTLGDLFESWLKRRAGVKDSGNLMPGHGGMLDRFDSMLWAIPFAWLLVWVVAV